ncbi:hypothetical protein [Candidatus Galacturonibacter soehngenii]|nr:hypothetical protein [Candidatus Galacturonibacter soehngenii]
MLSLIFNINPTIVVFTGIVTVLVENKGSADEVPSPTHPPSPTD